MRAVVAPSLLLLVALHVNPAAAYDAMDPRNCNGAGGDAQATIAIGSPPRRG
jgi:hypothetical protein